MTTERRKERPLPPFPPTKFFGGDVRRYLCDKQAQSNSDDHDSVNLQTIDFDDSVLRQVMEPHLCKAKQARSKAMQQLHSTVPYPYLRMLQRLEFSQDAFAFRKTLQTLLQVDDLALLHQITTSSKRQLLQPLLSVTQREEFHQIYQRFVCDLIIPHLHKQWYRHNNQNNNNNNSTTTTKLLCRYQAFPCLRVVRPNEFSIGPHCDLAYGHSIASLNVYVPLSAPIRGTNALYVESSPGREDWQPMCHDDHDNDNDNGVTMIFNGVECLHFTLENTTADTRVSLDFRVALSDQAEPLHTTADWQDRYSAPEGYYAFCESIWNGNGNEPVQVRQMGQVPNEVDRRVGFPF